MINKDNIENINGYDEFLEKYGQERTDAAFEIITEAFYQEKYNTKFSGIEILEHNKINNARNAQDVDYNFNGSFLFDNKIFTFDIRDGVSSGTEIEDISIDIDKTFQHLVNKQKQDTKRKFKHM